MYKIQTNSLAIKSQNWIANALLKLMESHPYKDITVTQICEEANLVRKTFYRNFDSKEDILHFILDNLFNDFQKDKDKIEIFFTTIYEYKEFDNKGNWTECHIYQESDLNPSKEMGEVPNEIVYREIEYYD